MGAGFVKVAADLDSNPKIRRAGRAGREVFLFVLRRTNLQERDGRCPRSNVEPWYLADQLMMPEDEAKAGVDHAIAAGLIAIDGDHVLVCGWDDEWAKRPADGAERTERWRNRRRSEPVTVAQSPNVTVTIGDDRSVTERHTSSPVTVGDDANVTESHGDESDGSDQIRVDQIRVDHIGDSPVASYPQGPSYPQVSSGVDRHKQSRASRAVRMPPEWAPRSDELALANTLGVDPTRELSAFRDHHSAKGTRFVDWNAAFRTWLRNAVRFRGGARSPPSFFQVIDSLPPSWEVRP